MDYLRFDVVNKSLSSTTRNNITVQNNKSKHIRQIEYNNNGTTVYGQGFGTVGDQGALSTARNIAIASAKLKAKGEIINNL